MKSICKKPLTVALVFVSCSIAYLYLAILRPLRTMGMAHAKFNASIRPSTPLITIKD